MTISLIHGENKTQRSLTELMIIGLVSMGIAPVTYSMTKSAMAKNLIEQKRYHDAIVFCQQWLKDEKRNAEGYYLLGLSCFHNQQAKQGIRNIRKAISINANKPEFHADLAAILYTTGDLRGAKKAQFQVQKLSPGNAKSYYDLAMIHMGLEEYIKASRALDEGLKFAPDHPELHALLGVALQFSAHSLRAVAAYKRAIELGSEDPEVSFNLGTVYGKLFEDTLALESYHQAIKLNAKYEPAYRNIANIIQGNGDYEGAIPYHRKVLKLNPADLTTRSDLNIALCRTGQFEEAIESNKQIAKSYPGEVESWNKLAFSYLCAKQPQEARGASEKALSVKPANTTALSYVSAALNEQGKRDEAAFYLDFDRLLYVKNWQHQEIPGRYDTVEQFNAEFIAYLQAESDLKYRLTNRTLDKGKCTLNLFDGRKDETVSTFRKMLEQAVKQYTSDRPIDDTHPFLRVHPEIKRITSWANVFDKGGFQETHYHPLSWLSGVYYPAIPPEIRADDENHEGWIEFGRAYFAIQSTDNPPVRLLQPTAGLMVLFPSYFGHRTIPCTTAEGRTSVAFDFETGIKVRG